MTQAARKIAIQTQLWGNHHLEQDFRPIFDEAVRAGFDGVECRYTVLRQKDRLASYLAEHPLTIVGLHASVGVLFADGRLSGVFAQLMDDMLDLQIGRLLISGGKFGEFEPIFRLASACRERGIQLLYHNHAYEFEHEYRMFEEILKHPGVGLALDIGWLHRAGQRLEPFLARFGERIHYFHIKDTTRDQWKELGRGELGMDEAIRRIGSIPMEWWTVEQDDTVLTAFESAVISRSYLADLGY